MRRRSAWIVFRAFCGGAPAFADGPPAWPRQTPEVLDALHAAYRSGAWGQYLGPHCEALVERMSQDLQSAAVRLCSSGTVAVELALRGLGVEPGDEVLIAAYDFPGNFRAIAAVGATPVVVVMSTLIRLALTSPNRAGLRAKDAAVIASHLPAASLTCRPWLKLPATGHWGWWKTPAKRGGYRVWSSGGDLGRTSERIASAAVSILTAGRGGAVIARSPLSCSV